MPTLLTHSSKHVISLEETIMPSLHHSCVLANSTPPVSWPVSPKDVTHHDKCLFHKYTPHPSSSTCEQSLIQSSQLLYHDGSEILDSILHSSLPYKNEIPSGCELKPHTVSCMDSFQSSSFKHDQIRHCYIYIY